MRFGLQVDTYEVPTGENHFDAMLAVARVAEETGFDSVWYEDHFMWRDEDHPEVLSDRLECFVALAALAAATTRVGIGALVVGVPYRNPALLAKMWTTLDIVSHGRAIVGLGAGWHKQEFDAYGWPFGTVTERMERLEDTIRIVDAMMTERPASYRGTHHAIDRALNDPRPIQRPRPPILVGGNGERRTLRLVAQYADMCNVYGTVEDVARKYAVLRDHCAAVGRPYDEITRTINYWGMIGRDDPERAAKRARFPNAHAADSPEETIALLKAYEAAGTQLAIVKLYDAVEVEPVRIFAEDGDAGICPDLPVIPSLSRDLEGDGGPMVPPSPRARCRVLGGRGVIGASRPSRFLDKLGMTGWVGVASYNLTGRRPSLVPSPLPHTASAVSPTKRELCPPQRFSAVLLVTPSSPPPSAPG